jgi:hypothetical protein
VAILESNLGKNFKTFAPCFSQSPPPASFLGFEISTPTPESRRGLGLAWLGLARLDHTTPMVSEICTKKINQGRKRKIVHE